MTQLKSKDFLYAVLGGLGFALIWIMLSLLLSLEPAYIMATAGGIAWLIGSLIIRSYLRKSDQEDS